MKRRWYSKHLTPEEQKRLDSMWEKWKMSDAYQRGALLSELLANYDFEPKRSIAGQKEAESAQQT
jgi:hypothetical protein